MSSRGSRRHGRVLGQASALKPTNPPVIVPSAAALAPLPPSQAIATAIPTLTVSPSSPGRIDSPLSLTSLDSSSSSLTSDEQVNSPTLVCPICNETMVTLLQLNKHIDDAHSEIEKKDEDILKSWFKKKVEQARQLPSVSLFNNKFAKLDIFDSEDSGTSPPLSSSDTLGTSPRKGSAVPATPSVPRFTVTKEHWQKHTSYDRCSDMVCDKPLNAKNGSVNCRKCGKLFCTQHTRYKMKLDKNAQHDPINGIWSRCCETCFKSREGYSDTSGTVIDISQDFFAARQKKMDVQELEVNKLEKRLAKLISALTDSKFLSNDNSSVLTYSKANQRRDAEKSVIKWQADTIVHNCPICGHHFGYTLRKHHCRLCGRVVCANLATSCSREVPISLLVEKLDSDGGDIMESISFYRNGGSNGDPYSLQSQHHGKHTSAHAIRIQISRTNDINIRLCQECKNTLFARRNFEADLRANTKPAIVRAYEALMPIRRSIDVTLPQFQRLLAEVNDPKKEPSEETLLEASKIRKRLMEGFVQLDNASRRVQKVEATTETEARLKKQIVIDITQYLQDHMIPLKALPRALKKNKPSEEQTAAAAASGSTAEEGGEGKEEEGDDGDKLSEHEVKELQEQLIILEEQRFLVSKMISEASAKRRFDEIQPLQQSVDDLDGEMAKVRARLGKRNQII